MIVTKSELIQLRINQRIAKQEPPYHWSWQCNAIDKQITHLSEDLESCRDHAKSEFQQATQVETHKLEFQP